ncbi:DUF4982 domain-containing protein [Ruminococcaceae bacterium OttesenSCG-928-A11]|nr:DUF4982 domain-containing protein [Ruminococcaceae bacterium OttesenSCG-928-A11]
MLARDFNKGWLFHKDGGEQNAVLVDLPHDAQLRELRSPDMPMDTGFFPGGKYVYTKHYVCPEELADKTILLEFDGVYMVATVWVNGHEVGSWPNGYTNFVVPLHKYLKAGEKNEIKVVADNSKFPNSRWYTGAGIYRSVKLYEGVKRHIPPYGVQVTTLDYKTGRVALHINTENKENCTVETNILFGEQVMASAKGFEAELEIPNVQLWSDKSPNLYTARVRLLHGGALVDECVQTFGVRQIEWDVSYGLKINGEITLLRGACVHHDNGLLGAAAHPDAEERKVRLLKQAGFNALRSSHNVCSKTMLEACDKHGMYMMDEFADMWIQHKHKHDYAGYFREWYDKDLTAMVTRDYNHPSVILYSIGNEVGESATDEGIQYARKMTDLVHQLDKSRPVTCGINLLLNGLTAMGKGLYQDDGMAVNKEPKEGQKESGSTFINGVMNRMGGIINYVGRMKKFDEATREVFSVMDIAGYNYGAGRYKVDPKQYPQRITVGSETLPPYQFKNWQAVKRYPNLIGDFMWTGWDYLGEAGLGTAGYGDNAGILKTYPALLAGCGVIEITGEFRPEVYWNQCVWGLREKPYIAVEPLTHAGDKVTFGMWRDSDARHSWAWPGCEGKTTTVTVYSTAHKVELLLDGRRLGRQRVKDCKAVFKNVPYTPSELKAVACDNAGKVVGEDVLSSAGNAYALRVVPEQETFESGRLLYVNILLEDENGARVFSQDRKVDVTVKGGTLLGLGSANPITKESYLEAASSTYNGLVQAIILPEEHADTITIYANSLGLEPSKAAVSKAQTTTL